MLNKRSLSVIVLTLFFGTLFGTLLGELLGWILPNSVVREFFLKSIEFNLGSIVEDAVDVVSLDLVMMTVKFGLTLTFNFTSIIGFATAYYFLRYFR
ncbi:DUF4321 domain-containing protein [Candidatus Marinimicrobia bacterium]|nr:DUF4321 domain-containing protein [Candidatus Neomarinimicrobiota bacterium]